MASAGGTRVPPYAKEEWGAKEEAVAEGVEAKMRVGGGDTDEGFEVKV